MKNICKIIFIFIFLIISVYYTNKSIEVLIKKDPIMLKIKDSAAKYEVKAVNSVINDDEVIPGLYGKKIDYEASYSAMKRYGNYNEALTKVVLVKPTISIEDNYSKYITKGNSLENSIAILIKINNEKDFNKVITNLVGKDIQLTFFIAGELLEKNLMEIKKLKDYELEILNYEDGYDEVFLKSSFSYLKQIRDKNPKFCYAEKDDYNLLSFCNKEKMHTIKVGNVIRKNLYKNIKNNLENGGIYSLDLVSYNEFMTTVNYIKSKGYKIVFLESLLSENSNLID